jgi:hypothetical protein
MLVILVLLTVSYFGVVYWVRRSKRLLAAVVVPAPCLPDDDQAPESAVGWPPEGARRTLYLDEGFAALDAYLAGAIPPESA